MLHWIIALYQKLNGNEWVDYKMAEAEAFKKSPKFEAWKRVRQNVAA